MSCSPSLPRHGLFILDYPSLNLCNTRRLLARPTKLRQLPGLVLGQLNLVHLPHR